MFSLALTNKLDLGQCHIHLTFQKIFFLPSLDLPSASVSPHFLTSFNKLKKKLGIDREQSHSNYTEIEQFTQKGLSLKLIQKLFELISRFLRFGGCKDIFPLAFWEVIKKFAIAALQLSTHQKVHLKVGIHFASHRSVLPLFVHLAQSIQEQSFLTHTSVSWQHLNKAPGSQFKKSLT